jgi:hypothetical protein
VSLVGHTGWNHRGIQHRSSLYSNSAGQIVVPDLLSLNGCLWLDRHTGWNQRAIQHKSSLYSIYYFKWLLYEDLLFVAHPEPHPHQIKIRIRIRIKMRSWIRIRIILQMTSQYIWNMSLYEHFFKGLSLYLESRIWIRIRVSIRVKILIRVPDPHPHQK